MIQVEDDVSPFRWIPFKVLRVCLLMRLRLCREKVGERTVVFGEDYQLSCWAWLDGRCLDGVGTFTYSLVVD